MHVLTVLAAVAVIFPLPPPFVSEGSGAPARPAGGDLPHGAAEGGAPVVLTVLPTALRRRRTVQVLGAPPRQGAATQPKVGACARSAGAVIFPLRRGDRSDGSADRRSRSAYCASSEGSAGRPSLPAY